MRVKIEVHIFFLNFFVQIKTKIISYDEGQNPLIPPITMQSWCCC